MSASHTPTSAASSDAPQILGLRFQNMDLIGAKKHERSETDEGGDERGAKFARRGREMPQRHTDTPSKNRTDGHPTWEEAQVLSERRRRATADKQAARVEKAEAEKAIREAQDRQDTLSTDLEDHIAKMDPDDIPFLRPKEDKRRVAWEDILKFSSVGDLGRLWGTGRGGAAVVTHAETVKRVLDKRYGPARTKKLLHAAHTVDPFLYKFHGRNHWLRVLQYAERVVLGEAPVSILKIPPKNAARVRGIQVDPTGHLYLTTRDAGVVVYTKEGAPALSYHGNSGLKTRGLFRMAVEPGPGGRMFVAQDRPTGRRIAPFAAIKVYTKTGRYQGVTWDPQVGYVESIVVDPQGGSVYVGGNHVDDAGTRRHHIKQFALDGSLIRTIPTVHYPNLHLLGMAVDATRIFELVTGPNNSEIIVYDKASGNQVAEWTRWQWRSGNSICVDQDAGGYLYLTNQFAREVFVLDKQTGAPVYTFALPEVADAMHALPWRGQALRPRRASVCVEPGPNGRLFVLGTDHEVNDHAYFGRAPAYIWVFWKRNSHRV